MTINIPSWCPTCQVESEPHFIVSAAGRYFHSSCGQWLEEEKMNEPNRDPNERDCTGTCGDPSNDHICVPKGIYGGGHELLQGVAEGRSRAAADQPRRKFVAEVREAPPTNGLSRALDLLKDASEVITDREPLYGSAEKHWKATASCFQAYLERRGVTFTSPILAEDIGMFFILDKVMRQGNRVKRDNLLDVCGYAACAQRVIESK